METILSTQLNNEEKFQAGISETQYINQKPKEAFLDIKTRLFELLDSIVTNGDINLVDKINNKFLELDFGSEFDINADKIGIQDAIFFVNLLNQNNLISYSVEDNKIQLTTFDGKKIDATTSLLNMLQTSLDSKKPIRLDFDKDVTVILKLDREGKIQAHFIPGNSEVEKYLKNNIQSLRQVFNDEEINYSYLGYSKYKDSKKEKRGKK